MRCKTLRQTLSRSLRASKSPASGRRADAAALVSPDLEDHPRISTKSCLQMTPTAITTPSAAATTNPTPISSHPPSECSYSAREFAAANSGDDIASFPRPRFGSGGGGSGIGGRDYWPATSRLLAPEATVMDIYCRGLRTSSRLGSQSPKLRRCRFSNTLRLNEAQDFAARSVNCSRLRPIWSSAAQPERIWCKDYSSINSSPKKNVSRTSSTTAVPALQSERPRRDVLL